MNKLFFITSLLLLVGCKPDSFITPENKIPTPAWARVLIASDSMNAAIRDLYQDGGKIIYIYLVQFPADSEMAPIVAVSIQKP